MIVRSVANTNHVQGVRAGSGSIFWRCVCFQKCAIGIKKEFFFYHAPHVVFYVSFSVIIWDHAELEAQVPLQTNSGTSVCANQVHASVCDTILEEVLIDQSSCMIITCLILLFRLTSFCLSRLSGFLQS